ncbi:MULTISPECIES: Mini-ribonuclease 3 [unclassified Paenibacillus]|uniref:Mini-ribonuclease 3 n=1 Tax=unclassified Paenibacillus TaxID=185978 RepID=UPI001C0F59E6|nr:MULTISPECIES: ribonuclease III domain-containing protein [unclassified Paenibacillus]MBU5443736.1 ribonuclease III [Paenibacillus sp. MSJ-34]CAH0120761.1 Mini-ribonuclease 3 [Paenibacillus sp. CECT 9249]
METDKTENAGIDEKAEAGPEFDDFLFPYPPAKEAKHMNPIVLAYIGDAIYEVAIRQYLISRPNHRPNHLHRGATQFVSAKAQSRLLLVWQPLLTEEEKDVVRQGRNAKSGSIPKNANVSEYRLATAFECLIGYLYYTKRYARLRELLGVAIEACVTERGVN